MEFSLILWPFLLLLLATCDYAQIYFYDSSLRHALRAAGRFASTGQAKPFTIDGQQVFDVDGNPILETSVYNPPLNMSRNESIRRVFRNVCRIKTLKDADIDIVSWPGTNDATEASPNVGPGLEEDRVRIRVSWPLGLITPVAPLLNDQGQYTITVEAIFRNEPSDFFQDFTNKYPNEP
ncbi:MAG: TadE/TadG family type IV pilus assembly protein [Verrucomicrobiota bacterium]